MTAPRRISSGSPYEPRIGFSRAIRAGNRVLVSGTAPVWPDGSCDPDAYAQAKRCFEIIIQALTEAGAETRHVVRTRMFVTDPGFAEAVGKAHGEVMRDALPPSTLVGVSALLEPRREVEIDADAEHDYDLELS